MTINFSDEINARTKSAWVIAREIAAHQGGGAMKWFGLANLIAALPEPIAPVAHEPELEAETISAGSEISTINTDTDSIGIATVTSIVVNGNEMLAVSLPVRTIPHCAANPNGYWAKRGDRPLIGNQLWCYLEYPPGYHDPIQLHKYKHLANHWLRPSKELMLAQSKRRNPNTHLPSPEQCARARKRPRNFFREAHIQKYTALNARRAAIQSEAV